MGQRKAWPNLTFPLTDPTIPRLGTEFVKKAALGRRALAAKPSAAACPKPAPGRQALGRRMPETRLRKGLATEQSIAYSARYASSARVVRIEAEALAAQPNGSGPGALTARTTADQGPPGTEASKGRDTIG